MSLHSYFPQVPEAPEDALECDNPCAEMNAAPPDAVDYQGTTSMQRLNRSLWCEGSGSSTAMWSCQLSGEHAASHTFLYL